MNARKETIVKDQVSELVKRADKVFIASGKKTLEFDPANCDIEELLKKACGRTGNLRAPTLWIGKKLYVGFNESMYAELV